MAVTLGLRMDVRRLFFDRAAATNALDKMERRSLARGGAMIRTAARRNIRNRRRSSDAGEGPTNRTGLLKDGILFSYEPSARSVVIGPVLIPSAGGKAPNILEFGGVQAVDSFGKPKLARYKPRPYMSPAMENVVASGRLPELFRNKYVRS